MSDKRSISRHPVIAGLIVLTVWTVGGLIFPPVLAMTKSLLAFVLTFFGSLGTPLGLPMWLLALG
ncbi:hypothetical protein ACFL2V_12800, partial [Pseudomonadota bacterium]